MSKDHVSKDNFYKPKDEHRTSDRRREANRQNGRLGAGRKSQRGREVTRFNAVRHGMTARTLRSVIAGRSDEKAQAVEPKKKRLDERLREEYYARYSPQGVAEKLSIDRIVFLTLEIRDAQRFLEVSKDELAPDDANSGQQTSEQLEIEWKIRQYYARYHAHLFQQLMLEELNLRRLQERRPILTPPQMTIDHASDFEPVSTVPKATSAAGSEKVVVRASPEKVAAGWEFRHYLARLDDILDLTKGDLERCHDLNPERANGFLLRDEKGERYFAISPEWMEKWVGGPDLVQSQIDSMERSGWLMRAADGSATRAISLPKLGEKRYYCFTLAAAAHDQVLNPQPSDAAAPSVPRRPGRPTTWK